MAVHPEAHLLDVLARAPVRTDPFPHLYVRDVFPQDFYQRLRAHLPPRDYFRTLTSLKRVFGPYPESRVVLPVDPQSVGALEEPYRAFWNETGKWLMTGGLRDAAIARFAPYLDARFGDHRRPQYQHEALLVQDYSTYKLDPHTDSPYKVLSLLFYLPGDESLSHLGTALYAPKDPAFVSDGTGHLPAGSFDLVETMPFLPNSLFAFVRTPSSFHGVEPIAEHEPRRDLLLFDIKAVEGLETATVPIG